MVVANVFSAADALLLSDHGSFGCKTLQNVHAQLAATGVMARLVFETIYSTKNALDAGRASGLYDSAWWVGNCLSIQLRG